MDGENGKRGSLRSCKVEVRPRKEKNLTNEKEESKMIKK